MNYEEMKERIFTGDEETKEKYERGKILAGFYTAYEISNDLYIVVMKNEVKFERR